jgi:hypothetical protein
MGGDGFYSRVDPKDPNTIYANMQNGGMVRFDRRTGERVSIQPQPAKGDSAMRWNWDAPLIVSPHANTRLYFGAQRLYRSDDRGDSWQFVRSLWDVPERAKWFGGGNEDTALHSVSPAWVTRSDPASAYVDESAGVSIC